MRGFNSLFPYVTGGAGPECSGGDCASEEGDGSGAGPGDRLCGGPNGGPSRSAESLHCWRHGSQSASLLTAAFGSTARFAKQIPQNGAQSERRRRMKKGLGGVGREGAAGGKCEGVGGGVGAAAGGGGGGGDGVRMERRKGRSTGSLAQQQEGK